MIALLDANIPIALFDEAHVHHEKAHGWLSKNRDAGWATCPLTQNACIRILSQASYPGRLSVVDISRRLHQAISCADHHFWPDTVSLCDPALVVHERILTPKPLTDIYLLALAAENDGKLVTFDRGTAISAVRRARDVHLEVLG